MKLLFLCVFFATIVPVIHSQDDETTVANSDFHNAADSTGTNINSNSGNVVDKNVTGETEDECVDQAPNCKKYAAMGLCYHSSVRRQMYAKCKATCGIGSRCCVDRSQNCTSLTPKHCSSGNAMQAFAQENCVKTCTKCDCQDHARDCQQWKEYCHDAKFETLFRSRCPATCGFC
ncbi:unnamed protein product [Gongylonema pulchrum]|uniref:ShKT domain-containing protein n=1 Tax=Gongylonema pulchrum TaxID=637853 RepID=A0A183DSY1_9BILA|nr:unnamed protein product [Gongylonema pulchrum]